MQTPKQYEEVTEAQEIIEQLCKKYFKVLWAVRPNTVKVLGISNKERAKDNKVLAKIIPIRPPEKAVLKMYDIPVRYIIEMYWKDWREWSLQLRQWIVFHELLHISAEMGKTTKHDCEDFRIMIDKVGTDWSHADALPDLLHEDVQFDENLIPNVEEYQEENADD